MKPHWLKRNHRTALPQVLVTVDTESWEATDPCDAQKRLYPLRLGVARYARLEAGKLTRRDHFRFTDAGAFWDWLRSKMVARRTTYLWAHNLGWDLCVLRFWDELEKGRLSLQGPLMRVKNPITDQWEQKPRVGHLITRDPPSAFKVWDKRQYTLKGVDTYNFYPFSLKRLGELVKLPKLEFPGTAGDTENMWVYCERDCEITERVVLELCGFVRKNDLGNLRYTPGGQALAAFNHGCKGGEIFYSQDPEQAEFERLAYFGAKKYVYFAGEVYAPEQFKLGNPRPPNQQAPAIYTGPVYNLDLSAAFASVMRGNLFPYKLISSQPNPPVDSVLVNMSDRGALAWCTVESEHVAYPVRFKDRTDWCVGCFQTGLCGPELQQALQLGHVAQIHKVHYYALRELFTTFVKKLIRIENSYDRQHEPIRRQLAKAIRNSLYGKFGQRMQGWEVVPDARHYEPWGSYRTQRAPNEKWELRRAIGYRVQKAVSGPCVDWTFPAICAYVTAYHRQRIEELIRAAGLEGTLYLDQDTIHVTRAGFLALERAGEVHQDTAGKLRLVDTCDSVHYFGQKCYRWGEKLVNAGLSTRAVPVGDGTYHFDEFQHLDALLRSKPPNGGLVIRHLVKPPVHRLGADRSPTGWTQPIVYVNRTPKRGDGTDQTVPF